MRHDIDEAVAELAQRQHGVFGLRQARSYGATKSIVHRRVDAGRWRRLSGRVLTLPGAPSGFEQRLMAAVIQSPDAVVSHTAAARLHGFRYVGVVEPEVTCGYESGRWNPFARAHRSIDLTAPDKSMIGPIPVTSPARTAADLLTALSRPRVERIVDDLLCSHEVSIEEFLDMHDRYAGGGRPTTVAMREILAERAPGYVAPGSVLESMALELFASTGLPTPSRQVPVPGWTDEPGLVDLAFVPERVLVELDGRRWHGRDQAYRRDRERDHAALLAGWLPLRFTWTHLKERPVYTVATVSSALSSRG